MKGRKHTTKTLVSGLIAGLLLVFAASVAHAQTPPDFPVCSNPQGELKVSYSQGDHAIPGENTTRTGSDDVYSIGEGNHVQCFCEDSGDGVQTNWWKISSLDQEEINTMIKLGWHFVPNGANWGLEQGAYMAKNSEYVCQGGDGGGTTTPTPTPTPKDNGDEDTSDEQGGVVLASAANDQKKVLAATGTSGQIVGLFSLGIILIIGGIFLRKRSA